MCFPSQVPRPTLGHSWQSGNLTSVFHAGYWKITYQSTKQCMEFSAIVQALCLSQMAKWCPQKSLPHSTKEVGLWSAPRIFHCFVVESCNKGQLRDQAGGAGAKRKLEFISTQSFWYYLHCHPAHPFLLYLCFYSIYILVSICKICFKNISLVISFLKPVACYGVKLNKDKEEGASEKR